VKARYGMALGGRAWRGWFPLGGELTSGRPDWKEGLYLGVETPDEHPRVRAGVPADHFSADRVGLDRTLNAESGAERVLVRVSGSYSGLIVAM